MGKQYEFYNDVLAHCLRLDEMQSLDLCKACCSRVVTPGTGVVMAAVVIGNSGTQLDGLGTPWSPSQ